MYGSQVAFEICAPVEFASYKLILETAPRSSVKSDNLVGLLLMSSQSTVIVVAAVYSLNFVAKVVAESSTQKYM